MLESQGLRLPPVYYGAVDSTPLWLCLLGELWRAGRNDDTVRSLLPNAARAAEWLLAAGLERRRDGPATAGSSATGTPPGTA